jgi:acetyl-CoA acyltransferase
MSKQLQDAYIVAASRTPIGKAPRGMFKNTRPDELLVHAIKVRRWRKCRASTRS